MPNTARADFFRRIEDVLGKRFRKEPNPLKRNGGEGGILAVVILSKPTLFCVHKSFKKKHLQDEGF